MGLTLSHVSKTYPSGIQAVKDFCLTTDGKEFITVVGPSGCGKTTLLRLIAGLEKGEGDIVMDGRKVNDFSPKERSVAMVFQNYALFPYMNVYDNMAFGLKISGTDKDIIRVKVLEAAQILGLTGELNRRPAELSGGQRQRVALGRAMVLSPKYFLFDEPLSNLDTDLRLELRMQIAELYERLDATFVYVTHDKVEAMTMGTRIVVMQDGKVEQSGTPKHVFDCPANKFVGNFMSFYGMNFITGKLKKDGGCFVEFEDGATLPADELKDYDGNVTVGIRAEDARIVESGDGHLATVVNVEMLGGETLVYASYGGGTLTVKTQKNVTKGDEIVVAFDKEKARFFDPASGKNILWKKENSEY